MNTHTVTVGALTRECNKYTMHQVCHNLITMNGGGVPTVRPIIVETTGHTVGLLPPKPANKPALDNGQFGSLAAFADAVTDERRRDVHTSPSELARTVSTSGALRLAGYAFSVHSLQQLCQRIGATPGTFSYLAGLREQIVSRSCALEDDRARLAETLETELKRAARFSDSPLVLRVRDSIGDCYATVSQTYAPLDAPALTPALESALRDIPGSLTVTYDQPSTRWTVEIAHELTPKAQAKVGEPVKSFLRFRSADNGSSAFSGSGGIMILACLNGMCRTRTNSYDSKRHRGKNTNVWERVLAIVSNAAGAAEDSIETFAAARAQQIAVPAGVSLQAIIPDYYLSLVSDPVRHRATAGVLTGRKTDVVKALASCFWEQQRDASNVGATRADIAQGWTAYARDLPDAERHEAQAAIGQWLANPKRKARF